MKTKQELEKIYGPEIATALKSYCSTTRPPKPKESAYFEVTELRRKLYDQHEVFSRHLRKALAQRDELLAALKALQSAAHKQNYYFGTVSGQVAAIIAKCEASNPTK